MREMRKELGGSVSHPGNLSYCLQEQEGEVVSLCFKQTFWSVSKHCMIQFIDIMNHNCKQCE